MMSAKVVVASGTVEGLGGVRHGGRTRAARITVATAATATMGATCVETRTWLLL